jgi:hypothetical protein
MIMLKRGFEGNQAPIILSKEQERLERAGNVYFKIRHYLRIVTVVLCLLGIIFNLGRYFLGYPSGNDNAFTSNASLDFIIHLQKHIIIIA